MWYFIAGFALGVFGSVVAAFLGLCLWEMVFQGKDRLKRNVVANTKNWKTADQATFIEPISEEAEERERKIKENDKHKKDARIEDIY